MSELACQFPGKCNRLDAGRTWEGLATYKWQEPLVEAKLVMRSTGSHMLR